MLELRSYADKMNSVLANMSSEARREDHPLLAFRPRKTVEAVVMTSDRGLCGAFNSNILKTAASYIATLKQEDVAVSISVIGKKAVDYFKRRQIPMRMSWVGVSGKISYSNAQEIANNIIESYINETIDEVLLIYNEFKSVIAQNVSVMKLLPISPPETEETGSLSPVFIYEPSEQEIYNRLLPKNIEVQVYRALLESQASEEAARMTAMENATKNEDEMISRLKHQYNKARQAGITKELMDIVGGVEALK